MRIFGFLFFFLLLISLLFSCKTTRKLSDDQRMSVDQPEGPDKIGPIDKQQKTDQQKPEQLTQINSEPDQDSLTSGELRGIVLTSDFRDGSTTDNFIENIQIVAEKVAGANYNVVFFSTTGQFNTNNISRVTLNSVMPDSMVPGNDPVRDIIDQMHQNDLKLYAIVDLLELIGTNFQNPGFITDDGENKDSIQNTFNTLNSDEKAKQINEIILSDNLFPQLKTYMKSYFRSFIEKHDIDGFTIDLTDFVHYKDLPDNPLKENPERESQASSSKDLELLSQRLKDLLEDIVVECMLIKPYLVNSIIIPEEDAHLYIPQYVEEAVVDFVISKFQLDTVDAAHEFQALIKGIFNGVKVAESVFPWFSFTSGNDNSLNITELSKCIKENKGHGYLLTAMRLPKDTDRPLDIPYQYSEVTAFPENLKKVTPFQVIGLNINTLYPENATGQIVQLFQGDKIKVADKEGCIGFIAFDPDTINIKTASQSLMLLTDRWAIPYKYTLLPDGGIDRNKPWVEFRKMPPKYTHDPDFHLLYKSEYPAEARISNDPVKVYKTGIFFKKISLNEGPNRIRASILTQDSQTAFYEREFIYEPIDRTRKPFPLWIDETSIEPVIDLELLPDENVQVSFQGSFGQKAYVMVEPGGQQYKCSRKDYSDYSQYRAEIPLNTFEYEKAYNLILKLKASTDTIDHSQYEFKLQNSIRVRLLADFPLVKIVQENSRLTYNLGPVRLGGPIRSELGPGVIMKVNGKIGENFRIRLNQVETGIISQENVIILPEEMVQPSYFITSISCAPGKDADIISIPYSEPVPYAVYPDPDQNRLIITLFGAKTSSTWITHRKGRKIIDKITWQQTTPETYEIYVNLKNSRIWGYDIRPEGTRLIMRIKYPPEYDLKKGNTLSGLKIAIEAGHGGRSTGAEGLSGILEKDINLDLALKLQKICESMGARVLQVRETDTTMSLIDKRDKVRFSDADLLISIHANAAGTSRGYLSVPGTSTYYHNPFWAPLAENVYDRLLELGLKEFGVVGSFNYTVIRVSQMPSILVEQAFMTHAEDEEKLADPQFRKQMAKKISIGIVDFLSYMKNDH